MDFSDYLEEVVVPSEADEGTAQSPPVPGDGKDFLEGVICGLTYRWLFVLNFFELNFLQGLEVCPGLGEDGEGTLKGVPVVGVLLDLVELEFAIEEALEFEDANPGDEFGGGGFFAANGGSYFLE